MQTRAYHDQTFHEYCILKPGLAMQAQAQSQQQA